MSNCLVLTTKMNLTFTNEKQTMKELLETISERIKNWSLEASTLVIRCENNTIICGRLLSSPSQPVEIFRVTIQTSANSKWKLDEDKLWKMLEDNEIGVSSYSNSNF